MTRQVIGKQYLGQSDISFFEMKFDFLLFVVQSCFLILVYPCAIIIALYILFYFSFIWFCLLLQSVSQEFCVVFHFVCSHWFFVLVSNMFAIFVYFVSPKQKLHQIKKEKSDWLFWLYNLAFIPSSFFSVSKINKFSIQFNPIIAPALLGAVTVVVSYVIQNLSWIDVG